MLDQELTIEVEPRCFSVWREPWAKRSARVTLFVDFVDRFVIVMDASNGFWFLPGGGVEPNESMEDAAKREATEELGLEVSINRIFKTFHVTLIARKTGELLKLHPFKVLHVTPIGGKVKKEYAANRKIILIKKKECRSLLHDFEIPNEYECMKPYHYVAKEVVRQLVIAKL